MMGSDSDSDSMDTKEEGAEGGFQCSLRCNQHLPYYSLLEQEAAALLQDIKANLSCAVQKQELWPGALYWTNRLSSYIKMYGFHFSKKDHIKFIRLLYELIIIPNLECPLLQFWSSLLKTLLKKPKTLTRSDLVLPWRPLYEVAMEVIKSKYAGLGMRLYSVHICTTLNQLIDCARRYFSVESTQEMLDEWRPLLCPFDMAMTDAMGYLSFFLPTLLPPEHHDMGFKLWFDELFKLWLGLHYGTSATEHFIKLFTRVAKENRGYIDWDPYLPQLFSRILRSFQLPVGPSEMRMTMKSHLEAHHSASFIISILGVGSGAQQHLNNLMISLESFYHPSNFGRQTRKLLSFLKEMSSQFIQRLKNERFRSPRWYTTVPEHAKLTEEDVDAFVQCLIPSMKMAIFSKIGTMEAALTLHNLALIRPEMLIPDLLNSTYTALETLTEPHQVLATLQCLTAVSREMLNGGHGRYPEGKKHLFSILTHALPGIDSNDYRKTLVSGLLISALVTVVPLVDCSASLTCDHFNMTEDEKELCSLTASFEDFILLYLDRCFALVENTRLEQATALDRAVSNMGKDHEAIMGAGISGSVHTILVQASSQLFDVALDKLYHFATSHVYESEIAGRLCADMCASAAKANPAATLKRFLPHCLSEIDKILEDPYQIEAEYPDHALIWHLQLLSHLLQCVGSAVLPYADDLLTCLKRCVHLKSKTGSKYAAETLHSMLQSLTTLYALDTRSMAEGFDRSPETHLYIRDWAVPVDKEKPGIEWHVPSLEELLFVDRILGEFLWPEMEALRGFMAGGEVER